MAAHSSQSLVGMAEAGVGGGVVGAPTADAWLQAWRAIAPQWEQMRSKVKVSGCVRWQFILTSSHEVPRFSQRWYYMEVEIIQSSNNRNLI